MQVGGPPDIEKLPIALTIELFSVYNELAYRE